MSIQIQYDLDGMCQDISMREILVEIYPMPVPKMTILERKIFEF